MEMQFRSSPPLRIAGHPTVYPAKDRVDKNEGSESDLSSLALVHAQ
jgi:hypothetical protein